MLRWEIKKILKDKSNIIPLVLMVILFLQISFSAPILDTQNINWDSDKREYVTVTRNGDVIANEKLKIKVDEVKSGANSSEIYNHISKEKLKLDAGDKYEDIAFYQVFAHRESNMISIIIMLIIILMIVPNLYTDEIVFDTVPIILSSKNKNKVLFSKLRVSILLPILLYGLYIAYVWIITCMQYGHPINGGLQAYRVCDIAFITKAVTINQFVIYRIIVTGLILLGVSIASMLSSFLSDNSLKSTVLSVGVVIIGKVLSMVKFLPGLMPIILSKFNYIDVALGTTGIGGVYNGELDILSKSLDASNLCIAVYVLIVVFGILGCIYNIKKIAVK
ncbi:hypothetical protein [Paraclostridium bifermentans]|uniref:hypothetical protein n=1 Tax=Paraclostridium bifermentans TaxID=1490 RepID=UPI00291321A2|nr:hypothetical protein [Paraclostridium bifermentans]MDU3802401.1 hypothetical protein [Paraclostridium bifermentans]